VSLCHSCHLFLLLLLLLVMLSKYNRSLHVQEASRCSSWGPPNVRTDEPTVDEVTRAINKLKNARAAAWFRWYSPELLKCAPGPVSRALHSLFIQVWIWHSPSWLARKHDNHSLEHSAVTTDQLLYSRYLARSCFAGTHTCTTSYRPVSLSSAIRLYRWQIIRWRHPRCGRLRSELHREFNRPLNVASLDIVLVITVIVVRV